MFYFLTCGLTFSVSNIWARGYNFIYVTQGINVIFIILTGYFVVVIRQDSKEEGDNREKKEVYGISNNLLYYNIQDLTIFNQPETEKDT